MEFELKALSVWQPDEDKMVLVAYETRDKKLAFKLLKYDGRLTHRPEMPGAIWWSYIQ
jgi:hypothetical protein